MSEFTMNSQLDELIRKFIDLADHMYAKGVINEEQYHDLTHNKIEFLNRQE